MKSKQKKIIAFIAVVGIVAYFLLFRKSAKSSTKQTFTVGSNGGEREQEKTLPSSNKNDPNQVVSRFKIFRQKANSGNLQKTAWTGGVVSSKYKFLKP